MERSHITIIRKLRKVEDIIPPSSVVATRAQEVTRPSTFHIYKTQLFSAVAVLLLMLTAISAARASTTISYFSDIELSSLNFLGAGILDFFVGESNSAEIYVTAGDPDAETVTPTVTADIESFAPRYKVKALETDPNQTLCNALEASAGLPFVYNGQLMGIDTGESDVTGAWPIDIRLPLGAPGVLDGDICIMKLVYSGWVDGENNTGGYNDEEEFTLTIHAVIFAPLQLQSSFLAAPESLELNTEARVIDEEESRERSESENNHSDLRDERDEREPRGNQETEEIVEEKTAQEPIPVIEIATTTEAENAQ